MVKKVEPLGIFRSRMTPFQVKIRFKIRSQFKIEDRMDAYHMFHIACLEVENDLINL